MAMQRRQPLPRLWMMTDERQGETLWTALARLPRGSGVVFRHYSLPNAERRALFARLQVIARRRRLLLLFAGSPRSAQAARADGSHGRGVSQGSRRLRTAPAHDLREIRAAERAGAHLLFLSPVFTTRSHPGKPSLGRRGFRNLARRTKLPVVALGGMDRVKARGLAPDAYGWAAIDAWLPA
jgi:thiamine-phosphate pyrophosphorylase